MRKLLPVILLCLLFSGMCNAQNLALHLDGKDNNVRTGIGFLSAPWTVEAWIKGDDKTWKDTEVIFGGGEYSKFNWADRYPLVLKQGKLYSTYAKFGSSEVLDDQWHHVALTCDGKRMTMFIDGNVEAVKDTAVTIIPGVIGASEEKDNIFGGLMDEVSVWTVALSQSEIREWMYRPLCPSHPKFRNNIAYYNFDTGFSDDEFVNWQGSGYHSFHLRNTRMDYNGFAPVAYMVPNDNVQFNDYKGKQTVFKVLSLGTEWNMDKGATNRQIMKMRIIIQGDGNPLKLESFVLDLSKTTNLSDIKKLNIYYTGQTPRSKLRIPLATLTPKKKIEVRLSDDKQIVMKKGVNYLLVTVDMADDAHCGDVVCVRGSSVKLSVKTYKPEDRQSYIYPVVTDNSASNPDAFRVVQWNIWHSGKHVPMKGRTRIKEMLRESKADIITMQEAYGYQKELSDSLHYNLVTSHYEDNLALYSHYSIERQKTSSIFCSNPVIVNMGKSRDILVNDCWIHYSSHPDYTASFPNRGQNVNTWIKGDSIAALPDVVRMVEKDTDPLLAEQDMPVIFGGDFNSCSHLDWTKRAARLHQGYGPVGFPASIHLYDKGYKDSFREVNPDENKRPEGTFAGIYGQLDFSRIDFLYYKGKIKPVSSMVIQTMPEIDDIWPSDHSALMTTFIWR